MTEKITLQMLTDASMSCLATADAMVQQLQTVDDLDMAALALLNMKNKDRQIPLLLMLGVRLAQRDEKMHDAFLVDFVVAVMRQAMDPDATKEKKMHKLQDSLSKLFAGLKA